MAAKKQDLADLGTGRWDDVRIFLAAHRHGSLGAAAQRLGIDTTTVSRRLAVFEQDLGLRLFERTRDGLSPTHAAERILDAAEGMEAAHARLVRESSQQPAAPEGTVRVSVAPGLADTFIAPRLVRLRARHPRLSIELDASVRPRDLSRHEADLAVRSMAPQGADLLVTKLVSARWIVAASPQLVKDLGRISSWNDTPWVAWDRDLTSLPPARWLAKHAPRAPIALRTSHFSAQLRAVESGLGVALFPIPYVRAHGLAPVRFAPALEPTTESWPVDDLWLVVHRALRDVPRVDAVWTFLSEELREPANAPTPSISRRRRRGG